MKTPIQILISELEEGLKQDEIKVGPKELMQNLLWRCNGLLEKEEEFVTNFAMDYVTSGSIGCAVWADGAPELDIDKSARDYYIETFNSEEK